MFQKADSFDETLVNEQLSYLGMLETIRIRRLGYAMRFSFPEFYFRYGILKSGISKDKKQGCDEIMKTMNLQKEKEWDVGKNVGFFEIGCTYKIRN